MKKRKWKPRRSRQLEAAFRRAIRRGLGQWRKEHKALYDAVDASTRITGDDLKIIVR